MVSRCALAQTVINVTTTSGATQNQRQSASNWIIFWRLDVAARRCEQPILFYWFPQERPISTGTTREFVERDESRASLLVRYGRRWLSRRRGLAHGKDAGCVTTRNPDYTGLPMTMMPSFTRSRYGPKLFTLFARTDGNRRIVSNRIMMPENYPDPKLGDVITQYRAILRRAAWGCHAVQF